ncbi:DUF58 domain-containing protein [Lentisphaera profundi]|uniref:DUF58 domain-containing protein n=1 Tax=Lentisphaera profundi TaxID=1658616 RepID=A0ABY7VRP8_9BACT|nr:DUF58 domain-containing protein [Lentisphaera profundi]WDE96382.1 DUF58 domain-containing protein [Lentisphaera profundi]
MQQYAAKVAEATHVLSERFSLPFKKREWRGQGGGLRGKSSGSSIDFREHREYQFGDDPRHINWQAYARSGEYIIKLYEEEVSPVVDILFDLSNSMSLSKEKLFLSQLLLNFAIKSCAKNGASCKVWGLQGDKTRPYSREECERGLLTFEGHSPDLSDSLERVELRRGSLTLLISDLLYPQDPLEVFKLLKRAGNRVLIYAPADVAEYAPDWNGDLDFIDIEDGAMKQAFIDDECLQDYHRAYEQHFQIWRELSRKNGAGLECFISNQSLSRQFEGLPLANAAVELCV